MTKEGVIKIRDAHKANKASAMKVTCDNMEIMMDNMEFVIWDDDNEILMALRVNDDPKTQAEAPFNLIATTYENIQFIEGIYRRSSMMATAEKFLSDGLISEKQKKYIDHFLNVINNTEVKYKNDSDFYYEDDPFIRPYTEEDTTNP